MFLLLVDVLEIAGMLGHVPGFPPKVPTNYLTVPEISASSCAYLPDGERAVCLINIP